MSTDENKTACITFLQKLKGKGKSLNGFEESLTILQDEAASRGLENEDIILIIDIVKNVDLGAAKCVSLIKCMIPKQRVSNSAVKSIITWCVTSFDTTPVTVTTITLQWIVGLLEYGLADRKTINMFYEIFFFALLKRDKLEVYLSRVIYELTKPEDVTRRQVSRLLHLQKNYKKPQKHISALLSLFKSYKPELVPEKVPSVGIGSAWKPIPDALRLGFEDARDRTTLFEASQRTQEHFKWTITRELKKGKSKEPILPSVRYFHMGSSIFKEKDSKSIFDLSNMEDLGKYHTSLELPCNTTSLLTNMAGYHLLMFADFDHQDRFSYNLYNTLRRAFLLEPGRYPREELNKLVDMTFEFLRYIQHGIPIVSRFLHEYLTTRTGEYDMKLLALLQWTPLSITALELEEFVLKHMEIMYGESSLKEKCEIIKTLRLLLLNLFVNSEIGSHPNSTGSPFLGQRSTIHLNEIVPVITSFTQNLIVSGLNAHSYDLLLLAEAFNFYEQMFLMETHYNVALWTFAPPPVIYGGMTSRSCFILSRVCNILLNYRETSKRLLQLNLRVSFSKKLYTLTTYANDLLSALWLEEPFSSRHQSDVAFLKSLPDKAIEDLQISNLDQMLSLNHHYAVLPYKCILNMNELQISSKEDMHSVASEYFPPVSDFLRVMGIERKIE